METNHSHCTCSTSTEGELCSFCELDTRGQRDMEAVAEWHADMLSHDYDPFCGCVDCFSE